MQKYSFNLARTESGNLVVLNYHDNGHIMGHSPAQPIKGMGHIKTRLYLWLTLNGLAGVYSIGDLIAARRAYQSLEGWSYALDGEPPFDADYIEIGRAVHCDVYGKVPVKIWG